MCRKICYCSFSWIFFDLNSYYDACLSQRASVNLPSRMKENASLYTAEGQRSEVWSLNWKPEQRIELALPLRASAAGYGRMVGWPVRQEHTHTALHRQLALARDFGDIICRILVWKDKGEAQHSQEIKMRYRGHVLDHDSAQVQHGKQCNNPSDEWRLTWSRNHWCPLALV
jgi:hypothetical protein